VPTSCCCRAGGCCCSRVRIRAPATGASLRFSAGKARPAIASVCSGCGVSGGYGCRRSRSGGGTGRGRPAIKGERPGLESGAEPLWGRDSRGGHAAVDRYAPSYVRARRAFLPDPGEQSPRIRAWRQPREEKTADPVSPAGRVVLGWDSQLSDGRHASSSSTPGGSRSLRTRFRMNCEVDLERCGSSRLGKEGGPPGRASQDALLGTC
jgi:hypothetical protein